MKQINKNNLLDIINAFIESPETNKRPMLIWFKSYDDIDTVRRLIRETRGCSEVSQHPLYGHSQFLDKEGKAQKIAEHPELSREFIYPGSLDEDTRFFLYHRYLEQLDFAHISYVLELAQKTDKPLVALVNDYSKEENQAFDASRFEEYTFAE